MLKPRDGATNSVETYLPNNPAVTKIRLGSTFSIGFVDFVAGFVLWSARIVTGVHPGGIPASRGRSSVLPYWERLPPKLESLNLYPWESGKLNWKLKS